MSIALPQKLRSAVANIPLRWVLILPFVIPTVGAVAMVGYLSYRSGQKAVEELGHQLATSTNDQVIQELKVQLERPILVNRLNVDAVNQGQLDLQDISAIESTLLNRLQQFDQISAALFINPEGMFRLVERYPTTLYLGVADPSRPDQISIYQLDNQSRRGELVHVDDLDVRRDRPFYASAVATGKPGWSPVSQYGQTAELSLNAFHPVYGRTTKQLLGVFAVHFRLNQLNQFLHSLEFSRSGQIIITEQNGDIIATSTGDTSAHPGSANANSDRQPRRQNIYASQDTLMRSLGEHLRDRSDTSKIPDQPQSLEFRYDDELQYVQITPFHDQYGLNWRIVTVVPKSHFTKAIQGNTQTTVLLCLLTLGIAIILGLIADELLIARFTQLNQASQELAAGNLEQRLPTNQPIYELNGLAQTFNQMADQLQHSFNRIQYALEESEEKFTTIFRTSPDPMVIASLPEGRILEANDSLVQFTGYSRSEMIGRTALELNFWSNLEQQDQYRALLQQQRSIRNLEVQLQTKLGDVKTVLLSAEVCNLEGQDRLIVMSRDITDRKATELALQQSEARYRAIVEDQTELISRFLPDTTLVFVNDAYCRYFGLNREDIVGKSYNPIIYEADRDRVAQRVQSMSINRPTVTIENRVVVNGEVRWTQWINHLLFDDKGNITEIQSVGRDITELKQTEEALKEREAMLRAIGDNLPKGFIYQRVYEPGRGFYYSYISAGVERLLGLKPEVVLVDAKVTRTVGFEEDLAYADQVAQESLKNLTPIELQMRHRTPEGGIGWSSIRSTPRRLEDGRTVWDGVEVDITDLKRAETDLRASEEQFRSAFDDAPIGVSLVSMTGQFVKVNARYCDLLGYTEAELLTLTFQEITHPDDLDADLEGVRRMLAGEIDSFQLEKRYITKDGTSIPVLINVALILDHNGQPLYSVGHVQDIRDRLKVQRMKDEFISVISHELRTPLTSIQGALDLLGSGIYNNRPEKANYMLKIAINNSARLVRLVNDILTLERLESGKVQLVMEQCQVGDLMEQAVEGIQSIADQSSITLCYTPLSVNLWAAPDGIIQALTNLLSNAIKFSAPGDTVWLKAELQSPPSIFLSSPLPSSPPLLPSSPSPHILFTVKDEGRGIPEDKLEIIFEQFQQVDVSDSCQKGGTGLGLAICKSIVQQHGGQIWVESVFGEGSTFYIALPMNEKDIG